MTAFFSLRYLSSIRLFWFMAANFMIFNCREYVSQSRPSKVGFTYILDNSNFNSFTFLSSKFSSISICNWKLSQTLTEMAVELINVHLFSAQQNIYIYMCKSYILFHKPVQSKIKACYWLKKSVEGVEFS